MKLLEMNDEYDQLDGDDIFREAATVYFVINRQPIDYSRPDGEPWPHGSYERVEPSAVVDDIMYSIRQEASITVIIATPVCFLSVTVDEGRAVNTHAHGSLDHREVRLAVDKYRGRQLTRFEWRTLILDLVELVESKG